MTIPSQAALTHLRSIKPNDGWSVQQSSSGGGDRFRLLRRNVPLSESDFVDIHYCPSENIVVGVMTEDGKTCQVLVDENGKPVSNIRIVPVTTYKPGTAGRNANFATARSSNRAPPPRANSDRPRQMPRQQHNNNEDAIPTLTPAQNKQILTYGLGFVAVTLFLKILAADTLLYTFFLVVLYLYMIQTCPSMESFDAKKELKRVLRGHHLPEDHPDKPRGFLEDLAARVTASVATEMATFPGYEITMTPMGGALIVTEVTVPTAKLNCYWIGAFGRWNYIYSSEIPDAHLD